MERFGHSSLQRRSFIFLLLFLLLGWGLTFTLPLGNDTRLALLGLMVVGTLFNTVIALRYFARARIWPIIIPLVNTLMITLGCLLIAHVLPMASTFYILSIVAMAMRRRLYAALWTALLSMLGQGMIILYLDAPINVSDWGVLSGVFFFVALVTGTLAESEYHHTRELTRRHRELSAERAVMHSVSQTFELERVLNLVLDQSLATLGIEAGAIFLADEQQTHLALAVSRGLPPQLLAHGNTYRFGEGITGAAAAQRKVLIVTNAPDDARVRPVLRSVLFRTQVSVPLIAHDRVVGVLNLNTPNRHQFTAEDVELLRALGASVAVAVNQVRLFTTLESRVSERTHELDALNRVTQMVTQSLDLDTILKTAVEELRHTLAVRGGWVRLYDAERDLLVLHTSIGDRFPMPDHERAFRPGEGVSGRVALTRQPLTVNLMDSDLTNRQTLLSQGYASIAAVPLIATGELMGVLGLASDAPDRFGDAELRWLHSAGNAIAIAIKNAQLFAASEKRVKQLATLREIDHALNLMLDLESLLALMLERMEGIVPYRDAVVLLLQDHMAHAATARGVARDALLQFVFDVSNNVIFQEMVQTRMPVIISDLSTEPNWVTVPGVELRQAWMGVPLIARGEVIGQIGLYGGTPNVFTREHADLMMTFADHAAVTIANMRLRDELHEQARHDSLTGALNHGAFIEELHRAAGSTDRLALIMLDLDNYKQYNDTYGHVAGDRVLTEVVSAIRLHIKRRDFVGRWGGEEFGIALLGAGCDQAAQVAARIRETLATTQIMDPQGARIPSPTVSQGIAAIPATARTVDELIDYADRALYHAKARGRDQIVTWGAAV